MRLALMAASLGLMISHSAMAAQSRLPLAKPTRGAITPALKPYEGRLHIERGVTAPRLKMAPTTPVAPMKPVKIKPAKK